MKSLIICPHLVTREEGSSKDTFEDELTEFKALAKSLPSLNIVNSVSFKLTKIYSPFSLPKFTRVVADFEY